MKKIFSTRKKGINFYKPEPTFFIVYEYYFVNVTDVALKYVITENYCERILNTFRKLFIRIMLIALQHFTMTAPRSWSHRCLSRDVYCLTDCRYQSLSNSALSLCHHLPSSQFTASSIISTHSN